MTLLELTVDVGRVADALEKIVFLLEKLVIPPLPADVRVDQASLDDLHIITPEDTVRMAEEKMRFGELHRVVPGSEAFDDELLRYEAEQKELHGETWKAPTWAAVFTEAARGGRTARQPADDTAAAAERN